MSRATEERPAFLGIDFGTTYSGAARFDPRGGRPVPVANAEGKYRTRSLVYFGDRRALVGRTVEGLLESCADDQGRRGRLQARVVANIKRHMLRPPVIHIPGYRDVRPVEVMAEILSQLKRDAEAARGAPPRVPRAVLAHPVAFDVVQRRRLAEAAAMAGFNAVELIEEPVAAALALDRAGQLGRGGTLVFDLGGSTLDLAFVVRDEEGGFRVAFETDSDEWCGGDDFDQALYDHLDKQAARSHGARLGNGGGVNLPALLLCRGLKEELSRAERAAFTAALGNPRAYRGVVERTTFEGLIRDLVEKAVRRAAAMAQRARDGGHSVEAVALVGGASSTPLVGRLLREALSVEVRAWEAKDLAVALGAACRAHALWGDLTAQKPRRTTGELKGTTGNLELRALQERERAARAADEWAACARMWAEEQDSQQSAIRCMRQAERLARSLADWLVCAEVWCASLDVEIEATKCLGRALGLAKETRDWATCAEYVLRLFPESPAAPRIMQKAESVARDDAERALCAEYRRKLFGGAKTVLQFGKHEAADASRAPGAKAAAAARTKVKKTTPLKSNFLRRGAASSPGPGAAGGAGTRERTVLEVLERQAAAARTHAGFRLYVSPHIEAGKLAAARESLNVPPGERALGFVDLSLLGSGKSGVLFGCEGVYLRLSPAEAAGHIPYEGLRGLRFTARAEGESASLLVNDRPFAGGVRLRRRAATLLCHMLNSVNPSAGS